VRLPKLVSGAAISAAVAPLEHTLWHASLCRRRYCAILSQLLELELMLLLALLFIALLACF